MSYLLKFKVLLKSAQILNIFSRKEDNNQNNSDQVEFLYTDVEQLNDKLVTSQNS